jgi:hypothetical protein
MLLRFTEYHPQNAPIVALKCHFHGQNESGRSAVPRNQLAIFFLGGLFSSQKSHSKLQNKEISHADPSVFHVVVLLRPQQPAVLAYRR